MNASKVLLVIVLCGLVHTGFGENTTPAAPTFQDLLEKTKTATQELFSTFTQVMGLPGKDQLYNDLQNITSRMQSTIQKVYEDLKQNSGNVTGLSAVVEKFNEMAAHLKEKVPDTTQLQENFQKAVNTLVDESKKVSNDIKNEDGELQKKVKDILESAVTRAKTITSDLQSKMNKVLTEQTTEHS